MVAFPRPVNLQVMVLRHALCQRGSGVVASLHRPPVAAMSTATNSTSPRRGRPRTRPPVAPSPSVTTVACRGTAPITVLYDGTAMMYRGWNMGRKGVVNASGQSVGAARVFARSLWRVASELRSTHSAFCLDSRSRWRYELYPAYKSSPQRLKRVGSAPPWVTHPHQKAMMKSMLEFLQVPVVMVRGEEADDVIATYTSQAKAIGHLVRIVGRDKDLLQLVDDDRVLLHDWVRDTMVGPRRAATKFRVPPKWIPDVQAMAGDAMDNIPGLNGIGIATASRLVRTYGGLDAVLDNVEAVRPRARRELLRLNSDRLRLWLKLTRLRTDVDVHKPITALCTATLPTEDEWHTFLKDIEVL